MKYSVSTRALLRSIRIHPYVTRVYSTHKEALDKRLGLLVS